METNNKVHDANHSLAPKIYAVARCGNQLITLMDRVNGNTLEYYIKSGQFNKDEIKKFIKSIDKLHKLGVYHGDLNPPNIFYNPTTKKFTFIDFTDKRKGFKKCHDYAVLMAYLEVFFRLTKNDKDGIVKELFEQAVEALKKCDDDEKINELLQIIQSSYINKIENLNEHLNKGMIAEPIYEKKVGNLYYQILQQIQIYVRKKIF